LSIDYVFLAGQEKLFYWQQPQNPLGAVKKTDAAQKILLFFWDKENNLLQG